MVTDVRTGFFASSAVPFAVATRAGVLLDVNAAFAALVGLPEREVRGMHVDDLMHPDDREATRHAFLTLDRAGGEVPEGGLVWFNRYSHARGGWRSLRWTAWLDGGGQLVCGVAADVTAEHAATGRLSRMAYDDHLTGLANRTRLLETIETELRGGGSALGVLFLDVDGFKQINDDHGHAAGDTLLCELSHRLRGAVRRTDVLARLGGDEFVVALPGLPVELRAAREAIRRAAGHVRDALGPKFLVGGAPVRLGGSLGAAAWPWSGSTAEELVAAADEAMYVAKRREGVSVQCELHAGIA
jgi:diguanylate cyclase (GGDEF)-like protein/PAS domain S-box-containing protein